MNEEEKKQFLGEPTFENEVDSSKKHCREEIREILKDLWKVIERVEKFPGDDVTEPPYAWNKWFNSFESSLKSSYYDVLFRIEGRRFAQQKATTLIDTFEKSLNNKRFKKRK